MTVVTAQMGLEARNNLTWIADNWANLRAALNPTRGAALNGMPHHTQQHPAPINLHISDLMHQIETETRSLARVLLEETDDWTPRTSTMPGLLYDIAHRYGHWTAADEQTALAFLDWAEDQRHRVTRALTLTKPQPPQYIGPCPENECDGELYRRGQADKIICPLCRTTTTYDDQKDWLEEQLQDRLMTQAEIRTALLVLGYKKNRSVISEWITKKHLMPAIKDEDLYRISDAIELAKRKRGRPATNTRASA